MKFLYRAVFGLLILASSASAQSPSRPLHSHNDYSRETPLELALRNGFQSVEADVWSFRDELYVGHSAFVLKGRLETLYLEPLLRRVLQNGGSVHGDGQPFYLWIEFKDANSASADRLARLLARYPIFTEFTDSGIHSKAVTVIVTGNEAAKERFVGRSGIRLGTRDAHGISSSDPLADPVLSNRWLWYALDWKKWFRWDARGPMPRSELQALRQLLARIRGLGRRVRFFNAPDRRAFWDLAKREGIDLVGTDRVEALGKFWSISTNPAK